MDLLLAHPLLAYLFAFQGRPAYLPAIILASIILTWRNSHALGGWKSKGFWWGFVLFSNNTPQSTHCLLGRVGPFQSWETGFCSGDVTHARPGCQTGPLCWTGGILPFQRWPGQFPKRGDLCRVIQLVRAQLGFEPKWSASESTFLSSIQHTFNEHLLFPGHCSRCWRSSSD